MPITSLLDERISNQSKKEFNYHLSSFNQNTTIIDYTYELEDEYFIDYDHLNSNGRNLLSVKLGKALSEVLS